MFTMLLMEGGPGSGPFPAGLQYLISSGESKIWVIRRGKDSKILAHGLFFFPSTIDSMGYRRVEYLSCMI